MQTVIALMHVCIPVLHMLILVRDRRESIGEV